jgi:hypothetical protein
MYWNNMKNNSDAEDKSFLSGITGKITYTNYLKLQKHIHYRREDTTDHSALPILPNFPTSQISTPP